MYLKHIPNCGRFALDRRLKARTALAPSNIHKIQKEQPSFMPSKKFIGSGSNLLPSIIYVRYLKANK